MLTVDGLHMHEAVFTQHPDQRWSQTATFKSGDQVGHFLLMVALLRLIF
jgi:hypothetical protein